MAMLDDFPIEMTQWLYVGIYEPMEVVGKKKKMAKVLPSGRRNKGVRTIAVDG
jgi:hypothetical protein